MGRVRVESGASRKWGESKVGRVEVVFASKIPAKRYFASNFSTWPGILLLLVVSTWQKHQYQGEKCARHGIN